MSGRATPGKIEQAKADEEYWERRARAANLKQAALSLDPTLGDNELSPDHRRSRRPNPVDRVEEAHIRGLELSSFRKALNDGDNTNRPNMSPGEIAASRQRTIETLVKSGKTDAEIQGFLERTSGFVDAL